jgi:hypothetical protein
MYSSYDNQEEARVIDTYETPAAIDLGEDYRTDHRGTPFDVISPTSRTDYFPMFPLIP